MSDSAQSAKCTEGLSIYQVGGSVRDQLLGLPVMDRDYVVVGASPEEMIGRGFRPVGRDFPVFLHPTTHEEYALARTERKKGHGYHGFEFNAAPTVTLEEDLERRDLTINAMALDAEGCLIDPYNGRLDLANGRLRHVSDAFREDPVRVLRLARFATRFQSFEVAEPTLVLCHEMQASGELDYLVAERVWQEMSKALMYANPSRFFEVLVETRALPSVWPELHAKIQSDDARVALLAMDRMAENPQAPLALRFALLCLAMDEEAIRASMARLKPPRTCMYWAQWSKVQLAACIDLVDQPPERVLRVIQSFDGIRQPDRVQDVGQLMCAWWPDGSASITRRREQGIELLKCALASINQIDSQPFLNQGLTGPAMADAIEAERLRCITQCLESRV